MRRSGLLLVGVWVSLSFFVACGDSGDDSGSGGQAGTGGASGGSAGAPSGGASGAGGANADAAPDSSGSGGTAPDATSDADQDSSTNDAGDSSPADSPGDVLVCTILSCGKDKDCGDGCGPCLIVGGIGSCTGYNGDT